MTGWRFSIRIIWCRIITVYIQIMVREDSFSAITMYYSLLSEYWRSTLQVSTSVPKYKLTGYELTSTDPTTDSYVSSYCGGYNGSAVVSS